MFPTCSIWTGWCVIECKYAHWITFTCHPGLLVWCRSWPKVLNFAKNRAFPNLLDQKRTEDIDFGKKHVFLQKWFYGKQLSPKHCKFTEFDHLNVQKWRVNSFFQSLRNSFYRCQCDIFSWKTWKARNIVTFPSFFCHIWWKHTYRTDFKMCHFGDFSTFWPPLAISDSWFRFGSRP